MEYHEACRHCVLNHECLLQDHDDVESCIEVEEYEDEHNADNDDERISTIK